MDPSLYKAVQEGNLNVMREKMERISTPQLTPNKNTLLHVAAQARNDHSKDCASEILEINGSLLCEVNADGETALHVAARTGNRDVVEQMMIFARSLDEKLEARGRCRVLKRGGVLKKLLSLENRNGDTALHEAIRNGWAYLVKLMIIEDPQLVNISNNAMETPLFLAVVSNPVSSGLDYIMQYCRLPPYTGPEGKTALHAVALYNWKGISEKLLGKHPTMIKQVDGSGWSALHYAALRGSNEVAEELLKADKSIAYIVAGNDNKKTALHIATCEGNVTIMEKILAYCPDCWEMVTRDGRNILHLSVEFEKQEAFKFIMNESWVDNLINQKDAKGNTPLHVYAATLNFHGRDLVNHPLAVKNAANKEYMTPLDVITFSVVSSERKDAVMNELKTEGAICQKSLRLQNKAPPINVRKVADTHMLVATLITTVAFAAGFTIPGGYYGNDDPNKGLAVLSRKAAFKIFIITDTLAMVYSASAVCLYFNGASLTDESKLRRLYTAAAGLVSSAMEAMLIAFMTGLYAVLENSPKLAIAECVICSFFFPVLYCFGIRNLSILRSSFVESLEILKDPKLKKLTNWYKKILYALYTL